MPEFSIMLSCGDQRDEIDVRARRRRLYQVTKHMSHVRIGMITDHARSKADYTEVYWQADAGKVEAFAGEPIDAVFCGDDYGENSFWGTMLPG
jgi:HTH-type transcriptional repressor of NAD biosynthesis genes